MKTIRWVAESGLGMEHLALGENADEVVAEGIVAGQRFGHAYGIRYVIRCTSDWVVQRVAVEVAGGKNLRLSADGRGNWMDADGRPLSQLAGCIDVDISATPFTNTLPIRRLRLAKGDRAEIKVAYISAPALEAHAVQQAYTCIEPGERYRYEALFRKFEATLDVDRDDLVLNYPSLFRRVS